MAYREFTDDRGRLWKVWDVYPSLAERRRRAGGAPGGRERRRLAERRPAIPPKMAQGWLTFESSDGERRRLAPLPEQPGGWSTASDDQLRVWWQSAEAAPPSRRLIE